MRRVYKITNSGPLHHSPPPPPTLDESRGQRDSILGRMRLFFRLFSEFNQRASLTHTAIQLFINSVNFPVLDPMAQNHIELHPRSSRIAWWFFNNFGKNSLSRLKVRNITKLTFFWMSCSWKSDITDVSQTLEWPSQQISTFRPNFYASASNESIFHLFAQNGFSYF